MERTKSGEHTKSGSTAAFTVLDNDLRYVDWSAIFAGTVLATALTLVLLSFGAGLGLSMTSPVAGEGVSLRWVTIAAGIWMIWTAVGSFAAGGYLAGRLRRRIGDATTDEIEARDGAHGVIVWAVGAVFGGVLAVNGASGMLSTAGNVASAIMEVADLQLSEATDYASAALLRSDAIQGSTAAKSEVAAILAHGFVAGEVTDDERQYVTNVVVAQTQLDHAAAQGRVDAAIADGLAARATAVEAANQARIVGVIGAFVLAATMLVSAAAAYFAAAAGGKHRDTNLGFRNYGR